MQRFSQRHSIRLLLRLDAVLLLSSHLPHRHPGVGRVVSVLLLPRPEASGRARGARGLAERIERIVTARFQ
jgi:hypothetical protein